MTLDNAKIRTASAVGGCMASLTGVLAMYWHDLDSRLPMVAIVLALVSLGFGVICLASWVTATQAARHDAVVRRLLRTQLAWVLSSIVAAATIPCGLFLDDIGTRIIGALGVMLSALTMVGVESSKHVSASIFHPEGWYDGTLTRLALISEVRRDSPRPDRAFMTPGVVDRWLPRSWVMCVWVLCIVVVLPAVYLLVPRSWWM